MARADRSRRLRRRIQGRDARRPAWHALESQRRRALPVGPALDDPAPAAVRVDRRRARSSAAMRRTRCWCSATTSPPTTSRRRARFPKDSLVADFLVERGDDRNDLNVFASRRGNWEVMLRAAFHNRSVRNLLAPGCAGRAHAARPRAAQVVPIWEAAERYRDAGDPVVIVAGRALRHRLVARLGGQGPAPARHPRRARLELRAHPSLEPHRHGHPAAAPARRHRSRRELALRPGDRIEVSALPADLRPRGAVPVTILRADGTRTALRVTAAVETQFEIALLRDGGVLPHILRDAIRKAA